MLGRTELLLVVFLTVLTIATACGGGGGSVTVNNNGNNLTTDVSGFYQNGDTLFAIQQSNTTLTLTDVFGTATGSGTVSGNAVTVSFTGGSGFSATYDGTKLTTATGAIYPKVAAPTWPIVSTNNGIALDGAITDWNSAAIHMGDMQGDSTGNVNTEIVNMVVERSTNDLYFRIDLAPGSTFTFPHSNDTDDGYGVLFQTDNDSTHGYWNLNLTSNASGFISHNGGNSATLTSVSVNGRYAEFSVPLSTIGAPSKIAIIGKAWYYRTSSGGGSYDSTDVLCVKLQ